VLPQALVAKDVLVEGEVGGYGVNFSSLVVFNLHSLFKEVHTPKHPP
jgi:hypothetical protein